MICPSCSFPNSSQSSVCVRCEHVLSVDDSKELIDIDKTLDKKLSSRKTNNDVDGQLEPSQDHLDDKEVSITNLDHKIKEGENFVNKLVDRDLIKINSKGINQLVEPIIKEKKIPLEDNIENLDPVEISIPESSTTIPFEQTLESTQTKKELADSNPKKNEQPLLFPSKVQKIKIDINQQSLPFSNPENTSSYSWGDQIHRNLKSAFIWDRTIAGFIDFLFIISCCLIFSTIAILIPGVNFLSTLSVVGLGITFLFIALAYFFLFTALVSKTLGMEHQRLVVVRFDGKVPSIEDVGFRTLGYCISAGCFGLGLLWAIFDPEGLTWHDRISKTLVIEKNNSSSKDFIEEN